MATQHNVLVIVGSLRKESFTLKIAKAFAEMAPEGFKLEITTLHDLSFFNQDLEAAPPADWVKFREMLQASSAVLFVTPEYNRSIPGVLKNALDWGSRPWGHSVWGNKPAALIGTSVGAIGTALAQSHLRNVLAYLDVPLMGQPEMFVKHDHNRIDASGNIIDDHTRKYLQTFVDRYVDWVKRHVSAT